MSDFTKRIVSDPRSPARLGEDASAPTADSDTVTPARADRDRTPMADTPAASFCIDACDGREGQPSLGGRRVRVPPACTVAEAGGPGFGHGSVVDSSSLAMCRAGTTGAAKCIPRSMPDGEKLKEREREGGRERAADD